MPYLWRSWWSWSWWRLLLLYFWRKSRAGWLRSWWWHCLSRQTWTTRHATSCCWRMQYGKRIATKIIFIGLKSVKNENNANTSMLRPVSLELQNCCNKHSHHVDLPTSPSYHRMDLGLYWMRMDRYGALVRSCYQNRRRMHRIRYFGRRML